MRFTLILSALSIYTITAARAQQPDTVYRHLEQIEIKAYFNRQPLLTTTTSAAKMSMNQIQAQPSGSLVSVANTVAGMRMEERSPGSYRLALRGSMIRSPYGVRNIKIYLDDLPFTDAGGNTYLNLIPPGTLSEVVVIKGPDASLYGPNSGGVVSLYSNGYQPDTTSYSVQLSGGSYSLFDENASASLALSPAHQLTINQSWLRTDGYRQQSALDRKNIQVNHNWQYSPHSQLKLTALYTGLDYQTPGGLTSDQVQSDRRQARLQSVAQHAAIYNKTLFGGISNQAQLSTRLALFSSIFGSATDLKNPFITNYEKRRERNFGTRNYLSYADRDATSTPYELQAGLEWQKGWYDIDNYDNESGSIGARQDQDKLTNTQYFFFLRGQIQLVQKLQLEGSLGLNFNQISYRELYPDLQSQADAIDFGSIWMPRVALSYIVVPDIAVRASVARGFSAPTIAEVRPSGNIINQSLKPETGTNYEVGLRWQSGNRRILFDLAAYRYFMNDALIRQVAENDTERFQNAGKIRQQGIEASLMSYLLAPRSNGIFRSLQWTSSLTWNDYQFKTYNTGEDDFSGNKLTAVPDWVWSNLATVQFPYETHLDISSLISSSIPLDDANTVFADRYHILKATLSTHVRLSRRCKAKIFVGVDNLLNEKYSLGDDINAFGGRYFNPAPLRNYCAGIRFSGM